MIRNLFTKFKYRNWKYCKHCGEELKHNVKAVWYSMKTGEAIIEEHEMICPAYNSWTSTTFPHDYYEYKVYL